MINRKRIRLPPFTETGVILLIFCCIAVIAVPQVRQLLQEAGGGRPLPAITQIVFEMSPRGVILIALALGFGAGLRELRPGSVWIPRLAVILTILFAAMILVGLVLPFVQGDLWHQGLE